MSLQLAVILVPVIFGFLGFALDLGRMYLIRGELSQAANALAIQSASQLLGTTASADNMQAAMASGAGPAYFYNFGKLQIGGVTGNLTSTINSPTCFATVTDASSGTGQTTDCGADTAKFVQVTLTADAPLLFFSLLPGGESRKTPIAAQAIAGISAPLCTACGIVPLALPPLDSADTVDFGFVKDILYTLSQSCTGTPTPINLTGTSSSGPSGQATVPYVLINRYDTNSAVLPDEFDQSFVYGAGGLTASINPTPNAFATNVNTPLACLNINDTEQLWANAAPPACARPTPQPTQAMLCGLNTRLDNLNPPAACTTAVTDYDALWPTFLPDRDVTAAEVPPYSAYTGNGRRIITVAIVDALAPNTGTPMTVLGFRQFLLTPNPDGTFINPTDANGRFAALYIGNPAPVQSGWFDTRYANSCPVGSFSGPGKVVLH